MRDINIDFLEKYKSVDKFIKDAYGSSEGVSEYIRMMESSYYEGTQVLGLREWDNKYKRLKDIRHIRNLLAHEVSLDADICDESDYDWLDDFRSDLFSGNDPLAAVNRAENEQRKTVVINIDNNYRPEHSKDYNITFRHSPQIPKENNSDNAAVVIALLFILIILFIFILL